MVFCYLVKMINQHVLYFHLLIHAEIYVYMLDTYRRNEQQMQEDFFRKIFTSHFIASVRKGLLSVCVWEGAGDRTETVIFWPQTYGRQRCVFLVLLMLNRRSWVPFCRVHVFFSASYQHLLWTLNSIGVPEGPFGQVWFCLTHLVQLLLQLYWNSNCLDFCLDWAI